MRLRTLGFVAAVLAAASLLTSCRDPQPPGRTTTTTVAGGGGIPGPAPGQQDCGVINKADPVTAAEREAASCFLQYHSVVVGVYLKIVDGENTLVAQATGHAVTVTRAVGTTVTKQTVCSGLPNSQFNVDGAGNFVGILGNRCQF